MDEDRQTRRVTIRLTPYQARRLWKLRTNDLPEGARPRTVTEVLVRALLDASRALERDDAPVHREELVSARHEETSAVHDERSGNGAIASGTNGESASPVMMASESEEARHH